MDGPGRKAKEVASPTIPVDLDCRLAVRRLIHLAFAQHADEHRPQRPVLLAVDQEFGEGAALCG